MIPASFSFLRDLANCPHKAWRKYCKPKGLPPLPEEDSPELREGITTHKLFETYLKTGGASRLPVNLEPHVAPLEGRGAKAEVMLGMTREMTPCGFFDDPWLRGKADVLILEPPTAFIVDWKTGKVRDDDRELRILSMLVRANHPDISQVVGAYDWLKYDKLTVFDVTDVNRTYHATVAAVEQAQRYEDSGEPWPCEPNALCSWCPVADCRFNSNSRIDKPVNSAMVAL